MRHAYLVASLLLASALLAGWLIVNSFVTYAPSVSAWEIQNIYISSIVRCGTLIVLLQIAAIVLVLVDARRRK
jgi:hypothetical protein